MSAGKNLLKILERFKGKKVLVIGDVMLDKYIWGEVTRISPEAPVPIVNVKRETLTLGGAANTANNISALGGECTMCGVLGKDAVGESVQTLFRQKKIKNACVNDILQTTQKIRVMGQSQQLMRIDYENTNTFSERVRDSLEDAAQTAMVFADVIIFSDYAKGVITKELIDAVVKSAKGKIIVADPKPRHFSDYRGVTVVTPNHKEAAEAAQIEEKTEKDILTIGKKLSSMIESNILITRGEKGMSLFEKKGGVKHIPTVAKEVYDVSGAGDTVTATLAMALACGASLEEASILANYAGGIKVGKIGTSTVSLEEIKAAINHDR